MTALLNEFAPAKLNLYLHILGRDQRGYHLLDSLVAFADVGDTLSVAPADTFSLVIDGPFGTGLDAGDSNLVARAAHKLAAVAGTHADIAITLTKNLPIASGIGGGSADAAATLRLLCRLWGIDPASDTVMGVAQSLGSDVPVCVASKPCFMGGVGERLDPCPALPPTWLVLANPGLSCPTKEVFATRMGPFAPEGRFDIAPRDAGEFARILSHRGNGLTAAAVSVRPEIDTVLAALDNMPGVLLTRMLGSGATCIGLFGDRVTAEAAAMRLRTAHASWWIVAGQFVEGPAATAQNA